MVKSNFLRELKENPLLSIIDFFTFYFGGKKQFLPNSDELENKDVTELLERLKGKSDKETLSNLLEWQERNLDYWNERGYLDSSLHILMGVGILIIFFFISLPLMVSFYIVLTNILSFLQTQSLAFSIIITWGLILWVLFKAGTLLKLTYVILWSYPVYGLIKIKLLNTSVPQNILLLLNFTVLNWVIFGISLFSLLYLGIIYWSSTRQVKSVKSRIRDVALLIKSTY